MTPVKCVFCGQKGIHKCQGGYARAPSVFLGGFTPVWVSAGWVDAEGTKGWKPLVRVTQK
jgi:hypothetical protein